VAPQSRSGQYGGVKILNPAQTRIATAPSSGPNPVAIPTVLPSRNTNTDCFKYNNSNNNNNNNNNNSNSTVKMPFSVQVYTVLPTATLLLVTAIILPSRNLLTGVVHLVSMETAC
jgi:hypothetical protein